MKRILMVATAALCLFASSCGGDDSSDPSSVSIKASGPKGKVSFEVPDEVDAGAAEITLENGSEEGTDAQLLRVEGDRTENEVLGELLKAVKGDPVADWLIAAGGPDLTAPGDSTTVTEDLVAGTYYIVGTEGQPATPLTSFEVSGDDGADLPDADATVDATEYTFTSDGDLPSGESKLLLDNTGATWHHFLVAKLADGKTIDDAKKFLTTEGDAGGPPPFEGENPIESTVLDAGESQLVTANLKPGKYAFFCFLSDKQTGGPPHVVKGMVSEIDVSE
jgi:hypothetical protein